MRHRGKELLDVLGSYGFQGALLIKNGQFLGERYYDGLGPGILRPIHSCTATVLGALMGIAIDKGYISSLEEPLYTYFPELSWEDHDPKKEVNLYHLLTMTTGLNWPEENNLFWTQEYVKSRDHWLEFILSKPLSTAPGERFSYCSGAAHLLSAVLQKGVGGDLASFAQEHLFAPMGIGQIFWEQDPQGFYNGIDGLHLSLRGFASFGLLYLQEGVWQGKELISRQWIQSSLAVQNVGDPCMGQYGFHWWNKEEIWYSLGLGGKTIILIPSQEFLAVFMAWEPQASLLPLKLFRQYMLF